MKFYPNAYAKITGNADHPSLHGTAYFYPVPSGGVLIETEVSGLPYEDTAPYSQFYAMHIHETGDCSLPFDKTGMHYNRATCSPLKRRRTALFLISSVN